MSFQRSKRERTTFGEVLIVLFAFMIGVIFIAFGPFRAILPALEVLEIIAIGALILRATRDALPKSVRNALG